MKSGSISSVTVWLIAVAVVLALGLAITGLVANKNLDSRLGEIRQELSRSQSENAEIKAEMEKLQADYTEISKTAEAVETLLSSTNKELSDSLRTGLRRNERLIKEKEESLADMQAALAEFRDSYSGMRETNQSTIQSLQNDINSVRKDIQGRAEELQELSGSLANLTTLHAKLKSNLEQVQTNLKSGKGMEKKLEEEHMKIVELQSTLKKRSDSFQREMTRMEGYIKEIRLELTRLASLKNHD